MDYKKGTEGLEVTFHHVLREDQKKTDLIYFCFTYPYTIEDSRRAIDSL